MFNKLNNIEKNNSDNSNSMDIIKKITIKINAENFFKKIVKIPILVGYDMYTEEVGGGESG